MATVKLYTYGADGAVDGTKKVEVLSYEVVDGGVLSYQTGNVPRDPDSVDKVSHLAAADAWVSVTSEEEPGGSGTQ